MKPADRPRKTVGVIGGMGPAATADFMATIVALTPTAVEQDHLHLIIDSDPTLPSRQAAVLDGGEDPGPAMAAMALRLQQAGADFLVMPCNTAHAFSDQITAAVTIPFLSIVDVTVAACQSRRITGLLTTTACQQSGVYQRAARDAGLELVLLTEAELHRFTDLVFRVKQGEQSAVVRVEMQALVASLEARGAKSIIGACTEIPLVLRPSDLSVPLLSSTETLARETIRCALGKM